MRPQATCRARRDAARRPSATASGQPQADGSPSVPSHRESAAGRSRCQCPAGYPSREVACRLGSSIIKAASPKKGVSVLSFGSSGDGRSAIGESRVVAKGAPAVKCSS